MARVHPQTSSSSSPPPPPSYISSKAESFTIWMKSLVFNTHGCTVYNSKGDIVYRVDNYDNKCGQEVYLMDIRGKVLFSIQQRKLRLFGCWDGYKWDGERQLCFNVRNHRSICVNDARYKIVRMEGKLEFKIVDEEGAVIAEIRQKQTTTGIVLGNDVFTLMVQPHVDHSLIMAIIMGYTYTLIN